MNKAITCLCVVLLLGIGGCSRQQSDWEKTRAANNTEAYEQFLKKYPKGEFTAQAQARVKELYEERDWQKARDTDTQEAYQAFLKQYPEGKWTEEARIRVENFTLGQAPSNATPAGAEAASTLGHSASGDDSAMPATPATAPGAPSGTPTGTSSRTGVIPAAPAKPKAPVKSAFTASNPTAHPPASASPRTPKSAATGAYGIQLGAFKSSAESAKRRWTHLDSEYPTLLTGLSPTVAPKKTASGTLYRLQVTGLTEQRARAICKSLKAKSQACETIHPAFGKAG